MASSKSSNKIGSWAFLIGILLAVVLGVTGINSTWAWVLVIIGLIIGLFNISDSETHSFLMASLILLLAAYTGKDALSSTQLFVDILDALLMMFVPATIIVAVKHVFSFARN